jgi:hypothetical protein
MKKLLIILSLLSGFSYANAQAPQGFSYQASVRNAVGLPYSNKSIKIQFSVLDSISNGPVVYKESHNTTTNAGGMFNLNVGMGTAITGTLAGVNWGSNTKFLQVDIDTTLTGNNYTNIGVQQLMSVPYALYAGSTNSNANSSPNYSLNPSADSVLTLVGGKILETGAYTVPANEHWKIVSVYGSPNLSGGVREHELINYNIINNSCECVYNNANSSIVKIKNDLLNAGYVNSYNTFIINSTNYNLCPTTKLFNINVGLIFDFKTIKTPIWLEPNEQLEVFTDVRVSIEKYK